MKKQDREKVRAKLEEELKEYRKLSRVHQSGRQWLREIREAMGVSVTELAYRLDCSRKMVYRIEECERKGGDKLEVMQMVAEAMHCELVYAIVPWRGKTLEETAERLTENPRWRTEKQEARRKEAMEEKNRKWEKAHLEWVRQQKEERAQAKRRMMEAAKMAEEWAAEQTAVDASSYGVRAGWKPPAEWWTAQSAEAMKKQGVPADWALRMALFQAKKKEGQGVGGAEGKRDQGKEGKRDRVAE
jgi:transcriptional regulator with XRE-family HTH domain